MLFLSKFILLVTSEQEGSLVFRLKEMFCGGLGRNSRRNIEP